MSRIKKITIIIICALIIFGVSYYFLVIRKGNAFIKSNVKTSNIILDNNFLSSNEGNSWRAKITSGKHIISLYEPGYLPYENIIEFNSLLPEFIDVNLLAAENLGSPGFESNNNENITADIIPTNNFEYSTLSSDQNKIIYFNVNKKSIYQYDYQTKDAAQKEKEIVKLDFITDTNPVMNIQWSDDKNQVLVSSWNKDMISTDLWNVNLKDGSKNKLSDKIKNIKGYTPLSNNSMIAYLTNDNKTASIYLSKSNGSDSKKLLDVDSKSYGLTLSPDATVLTYFTNTADGVSIKFISNNGKQTNQLAIKDKSSYQLSPIWSPDSSKLIYAYSKGGILISDKNGKKINEQNFGNVENIFWSNDNKTILQLTNKDANKGETFIYKTDYSGKLNKTIGSVMQFFGDASIDKNMKNLFISLSGSIYKIKAE